MTMDETDVRSEAFMQEFRELMDRYDVHAHLAVEHDAFHNKYGVLRLWPNDGTTSGMFEFENEDFD